MPVRFAGLWVNEQESQKSSWVGERERREKAPYDTTSVTQINLIKELQHSMAESHIIIQAKMLLYSVVMLQFSCLRQLRLNNGIPNYVCAL